MEEILIGFAAGLWLGSRDKLKEFTAACRHICKSDAFKALLVSQAPALLKALTRR